MRMSDPLNIKAFADSGVSTAVMIACASCPDVSTDGLSTLYVVPRKTISTFIDRPDLKKPILVTVNSDLPESACAAQCNEEFAHA